MEKIMWVSAHPPTQLHVAAIQEIYGKNNDVQIDIFTEFSQPEWLRNLYFAGGYADMVVCLAPKSFLLHMLRTDQQVPPVIAEMEKKDILPRVVTGHDPTIVLRGSVETPLWFTGLKRVRGVAMNFAPVHRNPTVQKIVRFTRHKMIREEREFYEEFFGSKVTIKEQNPQFRFTTIEELLIVLWKERADDFLLVAPRYVYDALCSIGVYPLFISMQGHQFLGIKRLKSVDVTMEADQLLTVQYR